MSLLNKYVEINHHSYGCVRYGYVLKEDDHSLHISLEGEILIIDYLDNSYTIKAHDFAPKLDEFIAHEAMHTSDLISSLIENSLLNHWYALADPIFFKKVEEAQLLLMDAYQIVAKAQYNMDRNNEHSK